MKKVTITKKILGAIGASSIVVLTGCGSDSGSDNQINDPSVNAQFDTGTAGGRVWAYYNFDEGKFVEESDSWHLALKGLEAQIGEGVRSAVVNKQEDFYQDNGDIIVEAFQNIDGNTELQDYLSITSVSEDDYTANGVKPAIDGWYSYDPQNHSLSPTNMRWIIKSASNDAAAKMSVTNITPSYVAIFAFEIQQSDDDSFNPAPLTIDINLTEAKDTCVDFESSANNVDCASSEWDVKFSIASRSYKIYVNGGESGSGEASVYGYEPNTPDELDSVNHQNLSPFAFETDVQANAFSDYPALEYGVGGSHRVFPNFRTYVLDLGADKEPVKLQVTNYYDSDNKSGQITMRYMSLADDGK